MLFHADDVTLQYFHIQLNKASSVIRNDFKL